MLCSHTLQFIPWEMLYDHGTFIRIFSLSQHIKSLTEQSLNSNSLQFSVFFDSYDKPNLNRIINQNKYIENLLISNSLQSYENYSQYPFHTNFVGRRINKIDHYKKRYKHINFRDISNFNTAQDIINYDYQNNILILTFNDLIELPVSLIYMIRSNIPMIFLPAQNKRKILKNLNDNLKLDKGKSISNSCYEIIKEGLKTVANQVPIFLFNVK